MGLLLDIAKKTKTRKIPVKVERTTSKLTERKSVQNIYHNEQVNPKGPVNHRTS